MLMKIAATYENGEIFQHFGRTENFKIYTVEDKKIISSEIISSNGIGHGALVGYLQENNVSTLVCGGIGAGAKNMFASAGINLYPGASGNADAQVEALLAGNLVFDPETSCNHKHDDEEHGHEGHECTCH